MTPLINNLWRPLVSALLLSSMTAQASISTADEQHSLIYNGDFATGTANWVNSNGWNGGNVMSITSSGAYCVTITQKLIDAKRWDFAVRQEGLTLEPGHTYTLKGKVWSTAAVPGIYVGLDLTASPYTFINNSSNFTTIIPAVSVPTTNNLNFT
jgi:hypothetical protein